MTQVTHASPTPAGYPAPAAVTAKQPDLSSVGASFREQLQLVRHLPSALGPAAGRDWRGTARAAGQERFAGDYSNGRSTDPHPPSFAANRGLACDGSGKEHDGHATGSKELPDEEADPKPSHQTSPELLYGEVDVAARWAEPMVRVLHQMGTSTATSYAPCGTVPSAVLEQIAMQLVRKAGIGANSVHLEFGAGGLAGGNLLIQVEADGLDIALNLPPGVDPSSVSHALTRRLERKGLKIARLVVE